jgi:hypothetical protein
VSYISNEHTASNGWQTIEFADDYRNITISNDDDTDALNVKLNDMSNDTIVIKAGEVIALAVHVTRYFYQAAAGTPVFRVMCDGTN